MLCVGIALLISPQVRAEAISKATVVELDKALVEAKKGSSEARQRLAVRRVIRDAQEIVDANATAPTRFLVLEFLFRAQQQLMALDDDSKHRAALLEISRELVKAPDEYAELRLEADLLLSQAELAKKGAKAEEKAEALRPFVDRYIDTPAGPKVLRMAMVMAIEFGDVKLIADLREIIAVRFAANHEMINFQRDKLGGQVFGAPVAGTFKRSDGKTARLPMDLLGRVQMIVFWSQEGEGLGFIQGLAKASKLAAEEQEGRMDFISFNLDDLPDAGESILRKAGVDWPALHLPGGREHAVYKAYARSDPKMMSVTPTGQTALVMSGVGRVRLLEDGTPDFQRLFSSALARGWSDEEYSVQLSALMSGDFLVFDPQGSIDPTRPPELKAAAMGGEIKPLKRTANSVPEETLQAIQQCFVAPPQRYRLSYLEAKRQYAKAVELCRKAIAAHPSAPDLWIVRNRLIIAQLGLWKTTGQLEPFEAAVAEAQTAIDAGYPKGCDVVAQFCLARAALREAGDESGEVIDQFVADHGSESASGPVLAVATLLSLDVADRMRIEKYREAVLKAHTEYPMMWVFAAALLDRHHNYWKYQVPFTAGWSYGRRQSYFMSRGVPEEAERTLKTELQTADGKPFRIPEDLKSQWTLITFSQPGPWAKNRKEDLPASPHGVLHSQLSFADARPDKDVDVILATFGGDVPAMKAELEGNRNKVECPILTLPDGINNPLVHRLGILSEDSQLNGVLIRKDGHIGGVVSGLSSFGGRDGGPLRNAILWQDEKAIDAQLAAGKVDEAKATIMALAPPHDPEAVDEKGRKLKAPKHSTPHLRARSKVYMALGEKEKALADAEEVYSRTFSQSGGMSMRTEELNEAEVLRDSILEAMK